MLEKFVRISGVHTGIRRIIVLTDELMIASWIVNNNKTILFIIIKLMQHKDTSQQAFLIIYLICIWSFIYFSLGRSQFYSKVYPHRKLLINDLD